MTYNGGKNGAGVYQKIISMMPPHEIYIEAFLGSGAILRHKKPAQVNIGVEIDNDVIENFWQNTDQTFEIVNNSFLNFLKDYDFTQSDSETLIYCDPPYLRSVRSKKDKLYKHEFWTEEEHSELLNILKTFPCNLMISGYESDLYKFLLSDWRKEHFTTSNRAGRKVTETVWLNFPEPLELHDYRYLGKDFRERERIKKKKNRWTNKLKTMKPQERFALMSAIEELNFSDRISPETEMLDHHQI